MQTVELQGYNGLGISQEAITALAEKIGAKWTGQVDAIAVAAASMTEAERADFATALLVAGVEPNYIESGMARAHGDTALQPWGGVPKGVRTGVTVWGVLATASAAASGYHGYKRNDSLGWGIWWFLMGSIFPVVTPVFALAQGFGKPKGK